MKNIKVLVKPEKEIQKQEVEAYCEWGYGCGWAHYCGWNFTSVGDQEEDDILF